MANHVILNKAASIERCLYRIEEEYADNEQNLVGNQTKQDAIVLNFSVPVKRLSIWPCMW